MEVLGLAKRMPDGMGSGYLFELEDGVVVAVRHGWRGCMTLEQVRASLTSYLHDVRFGDVIDG